MDSNFLGSWVVTSLSSWGAQSALISKGDLRSDFPSPARVYKGKNRDSWANRVQ